MRRLLSVMVALLTAMAPRADGRTPQQVLQHHVHAFRQGNVNLLVADYAGDAVVVESIGVFAGARAIRKMFEFFADEQNVPGRGTFDATFESLSQDVMLEHWIINRGAANEASGTDVVVVRHGKIVFQTEESQVH